MQRSKRTKYPDCDKRATPARRRGRARKRALGRVQNEHGKQDLSQLPDSTCPETKPVNERDHPPKRRCVEASRNKQDQGCGTGRDGSKPSGFSGTGRHKRRYETPYTTCRCHPQKSPRRKRSRILEENEEGHVVGRHGDVLSGRYEVIATLGEGTFGRVVECIDRRAGDRHVAVKILKEDPPYCEAVYVEIQVLQDLKKLDPNNTHHCVQMLEWFEYQGHVCIVFELLGLSTYDFIKGNRFLPFTLEHIRQMAYQICKSVNFLHLNKLTHTDLKPENILLVNSDYTEEYNPKRECNERRLKNTDIKVADFGNAMYDDEDHSCLVSTRPYRAPEVILGLGWSQPCDVWSIGCILIEYYLGYTVFSIPDDRKQLAMMEQVLGPLPRHMIKKSRKRKYFHRARLNSHKHRYVQISVASWCKPLKEFMTCQNSDHRNLFNLLQKMLEYDPAKRITLEEALKHPFFSPLKRQKRKLPPVAEKADANVTPKRQKKY